MSPLSIASELGQRPGDVLTQLKERSYNNAHAPYQLRELAPVLHKVFSHIQGLECVVDEEITEPFSVESREDAVGSFPRRVFHTPNTFDDDATFSERGPDYLPVFSLKVILGPTFSVVTDLPALVVAVEQQHTARMVEYGETEPTLFIDTHKQLEEYWSYIAEQLGAYQVAHREALAQLPGAEHAIFSSIESYQEVCQSLAQGFRQSAEGNEQSLAPAIDSTAVLERQWHQIEKKLTALLARLDPQAVISGTNLSHYSTEPAAFIAKAVGMMGVRAQEQILAELSTQARKVFVQHCEAELVRKTGLLYLHDRLEDTDDPTEVLRNEADPWVEYIDWVQKEFPTDAQEMDELKRTLAENAVHLAVARKTADPAEKQLVLERAQLQLSLAGKLCALVHSDKVFAYKEGVYALSDALKENYLNCIVRGQVLHQLWKHYCGEASLAVLADEHFFSVVRLADGSFLSLDGIPEWFTEDESVFEVGEHERLYESSVLCWKAEELREDPFNREEAIKLYKEAIRLAENDPNIKNDLAEIFAEDPATYAQAELLYKQALKIHRKAGCSHSLAELISKNPNRLAEAEKYHLEATQLAPEDPWYTASLGAFYHFTMPNLAKAKQYYTTTLQLLQRDSHALSPLTKSELEKLIVEL